MNLSNKHIFAGLGTVVLLASLAATQQDAIIAYLKATQSSLATVSTQTPVSDAVVKNSPDPHLNVVQTAFDQGVMMLHAKEYELAITAFHKVIGLAPEMPEAYNNIGYALLGMQAYQPAQDFFNSALELDQDLVSAYFGLAITYAEQKNYPLAIGAMETYRHRTTDEDPYLQKAYDYLQVWRDAGRG